MFKSEVGVAGRKGTVQCVPTVKDKSPVIYADCSNLSNLV